MPCLLDCRDIAEQTIKQEKDLQDDAEVAFSGSACKLMAKNIPQEIPIKVHVGR